MSASALLLVLIALVSALMVTAVLTVLVGVAGEPFLALAEEIQAMR